MGKKITSKELRKLVVSEVNRIERQDKVKRLSPKAKRRIMEAKKRQRLIEARAEIAHIELLEEGLFSAVKAFFKTGASALGKGAKSVGDGIGKMAASAGETAKAYASAIGDIADEKVKAVAQEYHKNLAADIQKSMTSKSKEMLQALIKGGMDEEEAKGMVSAAIQAAVGQAVADSGS